MKIDSMPFMLGVAARFEELQDRDTELMADASIGWIRLGSFHFDTEAFLTGRPQNATYEAAKAKVRKLHALGFQFMALTPGPRDMPASAGEPGSAEYNENFGRICAHLAREFRQEIQWWQVANELDIWIFRASLTMAQSVEFLKAGIRAIKAENAALHVGINITLYPDCPGEVEGNTDEHEGLTLAQGVYGDPDLPVDYAGFDSYPGTWREGGPESWHEYLDGFYELTGKPVIVQEFGYSGAGDIMTPAEVERGCYPCDVRKWRFSWRGEHSQAVQADFVRRSFEIFAEKPHIIGAIYYNWRDALTCWQCKESDCPAETAWGLLDRDGEPKLAYEAYKNAATELFGLGAVATT